VWIDQVHALATAGGPPAEVLLDSSPVKAHRCASGGKGGRAKPSAGPVAAGRQRSTLTDGLGRPLASLLTGAQAADCRAGERLLGHVPSGVLVHADKGYNTNCVRRLIEDGGRIPNIPPKSKRRWKSCFTRHASRRRNAIERAFGRLKEFRRSATRYSPKTPSPPFASSQPSATGYQLLVMSPEPKVSERE
jgi:transposase